VEADEWRRGVSRQVKDLFGRPLRVLLATWILTRDDPTFFLQEAQVGMLSFGEAPSGVTTELRVFVAHGLLSEFEDGRRVYFTWKDTKLWSVYRAIGEAYALLPTVTDPSAR
jgi:hypothetical protein